MWKIRERMETALITKARQQIDAMRVEESHRAEEHRLMAVTLMRSAAPCALG